LSQFWAFSFSPLGFQRLTLYSSVPSALHKQSPEAVASHVAPLPPPLPPPPSSSTASPVVASLLTPSSATVHSSRGAVVEASLRKPPEAVASHAAPLPPPPPSPPSSSTTSPAAASLLTPSSTTVHSSGGAVRGDAPLPVALPPPSPSHHRVDPQLPLAVMPICSSPSPSRQSAAPHRCCAPHPSHAITPLPVGTSLAACEHIGWAQTYPVVGLLCPNMYGPSIQFIRICFLRILHGYGLTEYPVRIRTGYVSDTYPRAD
jgi:hypothetical protein